MVGSTKTCQNQSRMNDVLPKPTCYESLCGKGKEGRNDSGFHQEQVGPNFDV